ncbi:MAG: sigma 54-interacting transcriptional regulator [Myxococcota bacterium]|nr:sigma 54-interacting transcriptional regulator [Myxococcota bacterium]
MADAHFDDELVAFAPRDGVIRFAGRRAVLLDTHAIATLRRSLVDALGEDAARGVLTEWGYTQGWLVANALHDELGWTGDAWREVGLRVHALAGLFRVVGADDPLASGGVAVEASFEVEPSVRGVAHATHPSCWTIAGVLAGYLSRCTGRAVSVRETECAACAGTTCRFVSTLVTHERVPATPVLDDERGRHEPETPAERPLAESAERRIDLSTAESAEGWFGLSTAREQAREPRRTASERRLPSFDAPTFVAPSPARGSERSRASIAPRRPDERPAPSPERPASRAMRELLEQVDRVAQVSATVLITGESGVGKERIARAMHDRSPRAAGPFVAVNCGAIPDALLESELFGHARGAFTGATRDRPGLFEASEGGTLFLDEIGELSPTMQVKLLRVVERHELRHVGENQTRAVDARLLFATHRDLSRAVATGQFREDLFYRIRVRRPQRARAARCAGSRRPRRCGSRSTPGQATSASSRTRWSARWRCAPAIAWS